MEQPKRTLLKTLTWRLLAVVITMVVVYGYTGDIHESLVVGITANFFKMIIYYLHERIWNRISFGRLQPKPPEYQI